MASIARDDLVPPLNESNTSPVTVSPDITITETPSEWNSEPMYQLPPWGEPLVCPNAFPLSGCPLK